MSKRNENRPGYKKTKVGWIPRDWECPCFSNVANFLSGGTPSTKIQDYWNGKIPWITSADIEEGTVKPPRHFINEQAIKNSTTQMIKQGTILLVSRTGVGKTAIAPFDLCFSQDTTAILCNESKINRNFVFYLLNHKKQIVIANQRGTSIKGITREDIAKLAISLPPLPEQKRIAEILSAWDRAIEKTRKLIDAKKRLKKGLMQKLLTGRIRFGEFHSSGKRIRSPFYSFPSEWAHPKIGEVSIEVSERNDDRQEYTILSCSKYDGFVDSLKYFGKQIYSNDTSNYKVIRHWQFGFPCNHIEEGSIGLLNHEQIGLVSPIYTVFQADARNVHPPYLYALLKTDIYQHIFASNTNASVDRRGSLRWKEFSKIRIPLPSMEEQLRILAIIKVSNKEIDLLCKKESALRLQKKGLMQKLLTGEIRVNC